VRPLPIAPCARPAKGLAAVCLAFLLLLTACSGGDNGASAAKTIRLAVDLPLTGAEGRAGMTTLNGIRFFVQRHPTLDGFRIALDVRDDSSGAKRDTSRAVQNLRGFIADPNVLAMIGPLSSDVARAQIPIANTAHLALVSPATSSRCLTKEPFLPTALNPLRTPISCNAAGLPSPTDLRPAGPNNYFRLAATDELQGPAAADYARKQLRLMRVAVLSDREAYGQALAYSFTARFNKLGGTVVARQELDPSMSAELTAFMERAKNGGAQGVYFGGTALNHSCAASREMARVFQVVSTPFLGGDGIALDPACIRDAGPNAIDIYATVPAVDARQIDSAQPTVKAFTAQFGGLGDFGPYTIAAYDATGVVYDALHRAIRAAQGFMPARESVVRELAATTAFSGVTGTFGFDMDGDSTLRLLSLFKPAGTDARDAWSWVQTVDYSTALPY
jgi:branched-chain amino acid transport system substrate-binding protein